MSNSETGGRGEGGSLLTRYWRGFISYSILGKGGEDTFSYQLFIILKIIEGGHTRALLRGPRLSEQVSLLGKQTNWRSSIKY